MKGFGVLLLVLGIVVFLAIPAVAEVTDLRIGLVGPMTGPGAQYGESMKEAAELAVNQINKAGGINGKEVLLFIEDDESNPAKAVNSMQKLVTSDKIAAAVGHYNSSCTLASMNVTQRAKVSHLCPISTAAAITEGGNPYIFRNCATNPMQVGQLAEWVFRNLTEGGRTNKAAVIHENTDYGVGIMEVFVEKVKQNPDWELTAVESYNPGDTDMLAQLISIKKKNPDVLLIGGNITEGAQIVRQANEVDFDVQFLALGGLSNDRFPELAGVENVEGIINVSYFEKDSPNPLAQEFVAAYRAAYDKDPDMFAAATYEAVDIIAHVASGLEGDAWKSLPQLREAIREGLAALDGLPGVQGPTTFDENGQADKEVYIVRWENGKRIVIYPEY
jgi:branched-chain amino acid transport system substrate-binding protein